jgi:hypothetical protein
LVLQWAVSDISALSFLFDYFKSYEALFTPKIILSTMLIVPLFLMAVPTFIMGFSFTISQLIIQDKFEEVGRKVGWLQFVNIVGSTLGARFVRYNLCFCFASQQFQYFFFKNYHGFCLASYHIFDSFQ